MPIRTFEDLKKGEQCFGDLGSFFCRFKDCVKTGDGIRAKKSSLGLARLTGAGRDEMTNLGREELTNLGRGELTNKMGRGEMMSRGRQEEWQTGMRPRF